ncbi:MAG: CHRD domain-containing protein [Actinomycetota bacterium]|nr:CHRD domain-containing protein [Actinomycetota bacterium]
MIERRPAWSRGAAARLASKAALVVLVMAATVTVAGAARVLPGPAHKVVARAVEVLTPFELPDDGDVHPSENGGGGVRVVPGITSPGYSPEAKAPSAAAEPGGEGPPPVPPGREQADGRPDEESPGRKARPVPARRPSTPSDTAAATQRTATLHGSGRGPGPGDRDGEGIAIVTLHPDRGMLCLSLTVSGISPVTSVHLHEPTGAAVGPIVASLLPSDVGCVPVGGQVLENLSRKPSGYYVEVHNAEFPGGALRGRLSR